MVYGTALSSVLSQIVVVAPMGSRLLPHVIGLVWGYRGGYPGPIIPIGSGLIEVADKTISVHVWYVTDGLHLDLLRHYATGFCFAVGKG